MDAHRLFAPILIVMGTSINPILATCKYVCREAESHKTILRAQIHDLTEIRMWMHPTSTSFCRACRARMYPPIRRALRKTSAPRRQKTVQSSKNDRKTICIVLSLCDDAW